MKFLRSLVRFFKERLELIVAPLVLIEGIQFVIAFFGNHSSLLLKSLTIFELPILAVLSLVSTIMLAFVLYSLSREKTAHRSLQTILAHQRIESENLKLFKHYFDSCSQRYMTYAKENAETDADIFQLLFEELQNDESKLDVNLERAIISCRENIKQILNVVSDVMTVHTGDKCAACIQIIHFLESKNIETAVIKTLIRDKDSSEKRDTKRELDHTIQANTIHQRIFIAHDECVVIADLAKEKAENRAFKTSSQAPKELYNALFIVPLPKGLNYKSAGIEWEGPIATLCVDNCMGNFDQDVHFRILQEFGWRLSVMLYRLNAMKRALDKLRG